MENNASQCSLWLKVIKGDNKDDKIILAPFKKYLIGRNEQKCQIVLNTITNPSASRQHALIKIKRNKILLKNLQKMNKTVVNQIPVKSSTILNIGDQIKIGSTIFELGGFFEPAAPLIDLKSKWIKYTLISIGLFFVFLFSIVDIFNNNKHHEVSQNFDLLKQKTIDLNKQKKYNRSLELLTDLEVMEPENSDIQKMINSTIQNRLELSDYYYLLKNEIKVNYDKAMLYFIYRKYEKALPLFQKVYHVSPEYKNAKKYFFECRNDLEKHLFYTILPAEKPQEVSQIYTEGLIYEIIGNIKSAKKRWQEAAQYSVTQANKKYVQAANNKIKKYSNENKFIP